MHLDWQFKPYKELTLNEFHDIIALRLKAFVVEQNCTYLDLDGKDKKAYHLLLRDGKGDVIATARILMPATMVRLSAGRNEMSIAEQALCFMAGANSIFTGERETLLVTPNPGLSEDMQMFQNLGLKPLVKENKSACSVA